MYLKHRNCRAKKMSGKEPKELPDFNTKKLRVKLNLTQKFNSFNVVKITGSFLITPDNENGSSDVSVSALNGRKNMSKKI